MPKRSIRSPLRICCADSFPPSRKRAISEKEEQFRKDSFEEIIFSETDQGREGVICAAERKSSSGRSLMKAARTSARRRSQSSLLLLSEGKEPSFSDMPASKSTSFTLEKRLSAASCSPTALAFKGDRSASLAPGTNRPSASARAAVNFFPSLMRARTCF